MTFSSISLLSNTISSTCKGNQDDCAGNGYTETPKQYKISKAQLDELKKRFATIVENL